MSEKEIARLEQKKLGKGRQSFVLHEDRTVLVTVSKGGNLQHFSMSLVGWDSEPAHQKDSAETPRITFTIFLILIVILSLLLPIVPHEEQFLITLFFSILILIILCSLSVREFIRRSYDLLIFRNPATGGQLVLHNNVPNEKEFSSFVEILKTTIKKFPSIALGQTNTTAIELREFARLRDDGILTNEEFEEAKRKLLSKMNSSSSIGFCP